MEAALSFKSILITIVIAFKRNTFLVSIQLHHHHPPPIERQRERENAYNKWEEGGRANGNSGKNTNKRKVTLILIFSLLSLGKFVFSPPFHFSSVSISHFFAVNCYVTFLSSISNCMIVDSSWSIHLFHPSTTPSTHWLSSQ